MLTIVAAELVPSSARSSSSAATPLPTQFVPLLDESLERVKEAIQRVMPIEKRLSALEEAEFEDEGGEEGALEKEMLSQGWLFFLFRWSFVQIWFDLSYADTTSLSAESHHTWAARYGSRIYRCSCIAPSRGIPRAEP